MNINSLKMNFYNTYTEVKRDWRFRYKVRDRFRDIALSSLASINKSSDLIMQLQKPRIQFLYIHHVFPDEEKNLERLIKTLSEHHTFISHSEAVEKILNRDIDKSYISFSSDDGFKSNIRAGEIFSKYGIEACFFVNPSMVGVEDLNTIQAFCKEKLVFPPVKFLDWSDINRLQEMGHEIGSHTMNHINIAETSAEEINEDLQKAYEILTQECGGVTHFAFPYGQFSFFNEEGRKAVFNAGYDSCASAQRGCHINHHETISKEELCIRRDHIILDWNIEHIMYFIFKSARTADVKNNIFPSLINS